MKEVIIVTICVGIVLVLFCLMILASSYCIYVSCCKRLRRPHSHNTGDGTEVNHNLSVWYSKTNGTAITLKPALYLNQPDTSDADKNNLDPTLSDKPSFV